MDFTAALQGASPLLLGMSRDFLSGQRGGVGAAQQGLALMQAKQEEQAKQARAMEALRALGISGAPSGGAPAGLSSISVSPLPAPGQGPVAPAPAGLGSLPGIQPTGGLDALGGRAPSGLGSMPQAPQLPPQIAQAAQVLAASQGPEAAVRFVTDYQLKAATAGDTSTEWERLTRGMSPEQVEEARRVKLGLAPSADTTLRVGAQGATKPPTFRMATPEEAQSYGGPGQIDTATGRFYPLKSGDGMTVFGPDGQPIMTTGDPGKVKPFTEGQSKDVVYATRARGALEAFEPYAGALTSFWEGVAGYDPTGVVRGRAQSDEFQLAQNAGEEFLQAILRKDTGAAITSQEQDLYGKTYLPQPGDNALVLEQKARARQRAVAAIEAGMSPAQMIAQERGLRGASPEAAPRPYKDMSDDELKRALGLQ